MTQGEERLRERKEGELKEAGVSFQLAVALVCAHTHAYTHMLHLNHHFLSILDHVLHVCYVYFNGPCVCMCVGVRPHE